MSNSLKHIYHKIQKIAETASTNAKIELLKEFMPADPVFRKVLYGTYSEHIVFGINKFPPIKKAASLQGVLSRLTGEEDILVLLKQFSLQPGVSMADKDRLFKAASVDPETYKLTEMMCKKDLCCGISAITINKAHPDFVRITPYQRCSTEKDIGNISFDPYALAQCKANGVFAYYHVRDKKFISRSGSMFRQMKHLISKISERPKKMHFGNKFGINNAPLLHDRDDILIGELLVLDGLHNVYDRKTGNGIITSCIYGTADPNMVKHICFVVWDCITREEYKQMYSPIAYQTRFFNATQYVHAVSDTNVLRTIESEPVYTIEEAKAFYRKMRAQGEEGAIIKNLKGVWKSNTSKDYIKMKNVIECDLMITGCTPHKKDPKMMGSIQLTSVDGKIKVSCGSGFTEQERLLDWNLYIGRIVAVEAEGLIRDKSKSTYSLYTPTFIEVRHDKKIANTYKEVLDIERSTNRGSRKRG